MTRGHAMERVRSLAMVVVLVLPSGACAQLKQLRTDNATLKADNAKLEAERDCCGDEKDRLTKKLEGAEKEVVAAHAQVADALALAEGQRQRAEVLAGQLVYMQGRIDQLDAQIRELLQALERAWSRKGRSRTFVDDLLRLERADVDFSIDACNECAKAGGGS